MATDWQIALPAQPGAIVSLDFSAPAMDLELPVSLHEELDDDIVQRVALPGSARGVITEVRCRNHVVRAQGFPAERLDDDVTGGTPARAGRELAFRVEDDVVACSYSVTPSELPQLMGRAAHMFRQPPGGDPKSRPR